MPLAAQRVLIHGAIGGLLAAAVVAAWFFVVDLILNAAFFTPALLATVILRESFTDVSVGLVLFYTVLHFGVFAALGAAAAWFLDATDTEPALLIGAVFGVGVLNGVHYGGLLVTGLDLLTVLPVVHVLGANLLGGLVMMAYVHRAWRSEAPIGWRAVEGHPVIVQGLATGLLGAGAVAFWFLIVDIMTSVPFRTPAALGSAVFLGASSAADVQFNVGIVVAYTFLHVAAFLTVGIAFVWVAERIERTPSLWLLAFMAFVVTEGLFIATVDIFSEWVLGAIGWWAVGVGNLVAVGVMTRWIWVTHPTLQQKLTRQAIETRV